MPPSPPIFFRPQNLPDVNLLPGISINPFFRLSVQGGPAGSGRRTLAAHNTRHPNFDAVHGGPRVFALPAADPRTQARFLFRPRMAAPTKRAFVFRLRTPVPPNRAFVSGCRRLCPPSAVFLIPAADLGTHKAMRFRL